MPVSRRHPIGDMTAEAILDEFVADTAAFRAPPLRRFVAGMVRVADLRHLPSPDDAYEVFLDRVQETTGLRRLPIDGSM
jgi:hypothetical protein